MLKMKHRVQLDFPNPYIVLGVKKEALLPLRDGEGLSTSFSVVKDLSPYSLGQCGSGSGFRQEVLFPWVS